MSLPQFCAIIPITGIVIVVLWTCLEVYRFTTPTSGFVVSKMFRPSNIERDESWWFVIEHNGRYGEVQVSVDDFWVHGIGDFFKA